MRRLIKGLALSSLLMGILAFGCSLKAAEEAEAKKSKLEYNTLVEIKSAAFGRTVWTHADSRDISNNATTRTRKYKKKHEKKDEEGKVVSTWYTWEEESVSNPVGNYKDGRSFSRGHYHSWWKAPRWRGWHFWRYSRKPAKYYRHHELLVRNEGRAKNGSQFYIIQSAEDPKKTGPIKYGDTVKIIAPYSGAGLPREQGLHQPGKVLWVHSPSRKLGEHSEIIVSYPEYFAKAGLDENVSHFTLFSAAEKEGEILQSDVVGFKSVSEEGKEFWVSKGSRWGSSYFEMLVTPISDANVRANGGFYIKEIDVDKLPGGARRRVGRLIRSPHYQVFESLYKTGESDFEFDPYVQGRGNSSFDEAWEFGQKGKGWVKFKARAKKDIQLIVSSLSHDRAVNINGKFNGTDYRLIIGGWNNLRTVLRRGANRTFKEVVALDVNKGADPDVVVEEDEEWMDYWFKVDNGTVTFGRGPNIDEKVLLSWKDPEPLKYVRYIGLGGWDKHVEYDNIVTSKGIIDTEEELVAAKTQLEADKAELTKSETELAEGLKAVDADKKSIDRMQKRLAKKKRRLEKKGLIGKKEIEKAAKEAKEKKVKKKKKKKEKESKEEKEKEEEEAKEEKEKEEEEKKEKEAKEKEEKEEEKR